VSSRSYSARRPGRRRDNTGVIVTVTPGGHLVIENERNGTSVELTQLHVVILLDGMLKRALADAEEEE
jgi:hypothetical protein